MYRSEAAFAQALGDHFNNRLGYFVQRIESGGTGRGIPDMFVGCPDGEWYWIELKNVKGNFNPEVDPIPYQPGQEAWHRKCYKRSKRPVLTIVAANNGFFFFIMESLTTRWIRTCETLREITLC